jgi:hypothetical protein
MTDYGDDWDEDEKRRASIIRRARTEGIEAAYTASLEICRDPKAPQQAKSNASRTLLQIGGLFDKAETGQPKDPSEMTPEEHEVALQKAMRDVARIAASKEREPAERPAEPAGSIFD